MGPNETPKGQLAKYLIGDLAVARRHIERVKNGTLPCALVIGEISRSVEDCVKRIERDIQDDPDDGITMDEVLENWKRRRED
jgi:hypothetical protein